jgi:predicted SAM-dependent methyltransferase
MPDLRRVLLFVFSHRTLALIRWDLHLLHVRVRNALSRSKERLLVRTFRAARPRYLNLGSGPRGLAASNWINVDAFPDKNVHHLMDFGRRFPFADASFDGIFSEHVLEHFTREDGARVFRECRRILAPGGLLRVIVPDAGRIFQAYVDDPQSLILHRECSTGLPIEAVNLYAYQRYEHQCLYDWQLMQRTLTEAGFGDITRSSYKDSANPALAIDDAKYAWESLYVEAR